MWRVIRVQKEEAKQRKKEKKLKAAAMAAAGDTAESRDVVMADGDVPAASSAAAATMGAEAKSQKAEVSDPAKAEVDIFADLDEYQPREARELR